MSGGGSGLSGVPPRLDDESRALLAVLAQYNPGPDMPVEAIRARARELGRRVQGLPPPVHRTRDASVEGPGGAIPVRLYDPVDLPVNGCLLWMHGGGFTTGGIEPHDTLCRQLAAGSGVTVVSLDYRLAPEHRFPAAVEDGVAVARWLAAQGRSLGIDPARLGIGGSSAGGNLAAAVALRARDDGGPPLRCQLLVYPVVDATMSSESYRTCADGYQLTAAMMRAYLGHYTGPGADPRDPLLSPLWAPSLRGLPPACVIVAELDPLRDEVEAYARRLREDGVPIELARYAGVMHGFFGQAGVLAKGRDAQRFACAAMARALGAGSGPAQPAG